MNKTTKFLAIMLLAAVMSTASGCFLWRNPNRADRGKRFPHDEHPGQQQ